MQKKVGSATDECSIQLPFAQLHLLTSFPYVRVWGTSHITRVQSGVELAIMGCPSTFFFNFVVIGSDMCLEVVWSFRPCIGFHSV